MRWLPAWVLIVGLGLTAALGFWSFHRESDQRRTVLEREAREVARALEDKVRGYLDTLPGLRVYGMLQQSPTDAEFLHYVQALSLQDRYPGLNLSFIAELVPEDGLAAFEARARADRSVLPQGHPEFRVHPPGPRSHYMVLRHLYPDDPPSFGYDLYDPGQRYRADVDRALATGRYVATGPLQLARDRNKPLDPALTSIVVRAALYRGGATPPTEAGRRANALGVVGVGFRVQPLVNAVLPPHLARLMRLRVVDEQALAGAVMGLLFDSAPDRQAQAAAPFWSGRITVADRQWTVTAHPHGGAWAGQESTGILVLFGAGLSLALAALTRTLAQANLKTQAQLGDAAQELMKERDQLQLSEARFRMLFEHSFDAVLRTRPDGRVLAANASACALFGADVQTLQSLPRERLVDGTDPRLATLLQERSRSGRVSGALRMRRVDGSLFEAEVSSNIYTDGDGQQATSMIIRDVTERQRLADRLQERQRLEAIGTLAGGVAHDFNNMLAAILGNVGLAQQDIPPDSPAQARLRLVRQAGNRARQLVRQILTFSRQAPREQAVQPLQPLVDEAMALMRSTLPPTVRLQVQPSPVPLWARVDGAQIQQLLMNLCTNAWQALPAETGEVRVALECCSLTAPDARLLGLAAGDHACLHVDDDGHGMDAVVRARIFEPFFTTKPPGRGTGLGLAVVHGVVTEHAGAIRVDSEPGRGTRISVFLPLASAPAAEAGDAQPPATAMPAAADPGGMTSQRCARILYVDDDEVVALTALALLQRAGHTVRVAASGEAALAALGATGGQVDVVVTDFNMPGLSGLGVAEAVRQASPGTRVILVSGLVTDDLRQRARQLGIPEVLPKEELLERLLHAVQQALATPADGRPPAPGG
ncbi:CHASE domain-containing protein [Pseudaquabacterium pictum]|uniref:CHASE domain-containing protein n=1 Tax=Pseudaquabacterium pictum TaxID=2315236 RepID=UPI001396BFA2|nr:CHASE domain-containing protein [Rubrivivax pictus]